jgi:hypothetical protein
MATEIYQPPQELPVTTVVYGVGPVTGSSLYEDPNNVVFAGDLQLVGQNVSVEVS